MHRSSRRSIWHQFASITYRGVELAGKFLSLQPCRRGFSGRGWPECVQLDQGYATVASLDDSTIFIALALSEGSQRAGWPECLELDRGYAPVASSDNLTIVFLFRSPRLFSFQTLAERASFGRGSLSRVEGKL